MKFPSILLLFCFFLVCSIQAAETNALVPLNDTKHQLDALWDDMMRNIAGFKKLNRTKTFSWLFDFFSVKEYVNGNLVLLTQCLDLMIYELLQDVFVLKGMIKLTALPDLDELGYNPPLDYFQKMDIRATLMANQASKLPEISKGWVVTLCKTQKSAVQELIEKINSGLPARIEGTKELADIINVLCDFRHFYDNHTAEEVPLDLELLTALMDSPLLFKLFKRGFAGLKDHPLEFPEPSLIPAFLVYHKPSRPHLPLKALFLLLIHARKALAFFYTEYEDKYHHFDIIRMLSVIPDVFPTIDEKLARVREVLSEARELCINGQPFKDSHWPHKKTILSAIIYGLHLLDNEPSKIKVASTIADCCIIGIGGIMAEKNPTLLLAGARTLSQALSTRNMPERVKMLNNAETFLPWYSQSSADAKYWLHKLFEIISICHCAIDEHVKPLLEPVVVSKAYGLVYKNLHDRMCSQYGSLKNLKGEKLFTAGDLFCNNERVRLGVAEYVKSGSIDIKGSGRDMIESPSAFTPSPSSVSPKESISPHDDIDQLVAKIEGPKKPEKKPKTKKNKEPIMFIDDTADWEDSEEEFDSETSDTSDAVGNSSSNEPEDVIEDATEDVNQSDIPADERDCSPVHIMSLVDSEDMDFLDKIDARDMVYAYLLIGNSVFYRFISPLIARLQTHQVFLYPVFLQSLSKFESEVQILWSTQRPILKEIFDDLGIAGMSFFGGCVKFYGKRLKIAHMHPPMNAELRKSYAKMHLSTLNASVHSFYEKGSDTVREHQYNFSITPSSAFQVCTFITEDRSGLPAEDDINYELSILGLFGLFKTAHEARLSGGRTSVNLRTLRRPIAHQRPSNHLLSAIINTIFIDSHHYHFLHKLLQ